MNALGSKASVGTGRRVVKRSRESASRTDGWPPVVAEVLRRVVEAGDQHLAGDLAELDELPHGDALGEEIGQAPDAEVVEAQGDGALHVAEGPLGEVGGDAPVHAAVLPAVAAALDGELLRLAGDGGARVVVVELDVEEGRLGVLDEGERIGQGLARLPREAADHRGEGDDVAL